MGKGTSGEEGVGACAIGCACVGCVGGLVAGGLIWAYKIWPAMGSTAALTGLGQWLMTFLGPGESFLVATGFAGAATLGCAGLCLAGACRIITSSNDLTPENLQSNTEAGQELVSIEVASQKLVASLGALKQDATFEKSDKESKDLEMQPITHEEKPAEIKHSSSVTHIKTAAYNIADTMRSRLQNTLSAVSIFRSSTVKNQDDAKKEEVVLRRTLTV